MILSDQKRLQLDIIFKSWGERLSADVMVLMTSLVGIQYIQRQEKRWDQMKRCTCGKT